MIIAVNDRSFDIVINEKHGKYIALIDNQSFDVVPEFDKTGQISAISLDGKRYDIRLNKSKGNYFVNLFSRPFTASITQAKTEVKDTLLEQRNIVIKSPMSGLVIMMPIKIGQEIKKDSSLLTLEAMKMQNDIKSPSNARVLELFVKVGQTVEKDDKLLILEPL
jgi:biotin carboxyl carrier protein